MTTESGWRDEDEDGERPPTVDRLIPESIPCCIRDEREAKAASSLGLAWSNFCRASFCSWSCCCICKFCCTAEAKNALWIICWWTNCCWMTLDVPTIGTVIPATLVKAAVDELEDLSSVTFFKLTWEETPGLTPPPLICLVNREDEPQRVLTSEVSTSRESKREGLPPPLIEAARDRASLNSSRFPSRTGLNKSSKYWSKSDMREGILTFLTWEAREGASEVSDIALLLGPML